MSTTRQNDDVCCTGVALLPSGDVLVAGGFGPQGVLSSAEVYRVATGSWDPTGDLVFGRDAGFSLTPLLDGRVLLVGGRDDWGPLAYAELFDEDTGAWTRTNDMNLPRMLPATALLADGRVLLAGGGVLQPGFAVSATAEVFSPT
jgi:large repetitive protein